MEHYVCTGGCGGVSSTTGSCQADNCPQHGEPLAKCGCEDNKHEQGYSAPTNGVKEIDLDAALDDSDSGEKSA